LILRAKNTVSGVTPARVVVRLLWLIRLRLTEITLVLGRIVAMHARKVLLGHIAYFLLIRVSRDMGVVREELLLHLS